MTAPKKKSDDQILTDMASAVSKVLVDHGCMVTKLHIVAEAIEIVDGQQERAIWIANDDSSMPWDIMGLLDYSIARARAEAAED